MTMDRQGRYRGHAQARGITSKLLRSASTLAMSVLCALATPQQVAAGGTPGETPAPDVAATVHYMVPTDGMITPRAARRMRHSAAPRRLHKSDDDSVTWLFDYMGHLLDAEPAAAKRHRIAQHKPEQSATPRPSKTAERTAPFVFAVTTQTKQPSKFVTLTPVDPPSRPGTSPIVTGAVAAPHVISNAPDVNDELIVAAERSQLRADMIKLEFVLRTYDEQKTSGQYVFETRNDWRVLERARDAMTDAELSSASVAGFEANTYINETTRTIVVAVAGTQDLRRDFIGADIWKALVRSESPQHFYLAKTYTRSVIQRYQSQGYSTECVGHSLGGGACAYAAAELGIRALVVNPISAGKLAPPARVLVTNYVVDGEIASVVYGARGHKFPGDTQVINDGRDVVRLMALEKYGQLAGPILVVRELHAGIKSHKAEHALDLIAAQAEAARPK